MGLAEATGAAENVEEECLAMGVAEVAEKAEEDCLLPDLLAETPVAAENVEEESFFDAEEERQDIEGVSSPLHQEHQTQEVTKAEAQQVVCEESEEGANC